jgi:membrane protease YdiL (CAAX protease family)
MTDWTLPRFALPHQTRPAPVYAGLVPVARRIVLGLGLTLLFGSLLAAATAVIGMERRELEHESPWASLAERAAQPGATGVSARLTELPLAVGDEASFELCARADLRASGAQDVLELMVWQPAGARLELRVPLDAAHLAQTRAGAELSCLELGAGRIAHAGRYALDAVWPGRSLPPALAAIPLRARVLVRRPLGTREGLLVLGAALGSMLCVLASFSPAPRLALTPAQQRRGPPLAVGFALLGMLLFTGALHLPLGGASGGLARGVLVALVELGLAAGGAWLVFQHAQRGLCLVAPSQRPGAWLLVACLAALALHPLTRLAMQLAPPGERAPIEAFISWPSGALSFAMLGMAVPLAEELFFRGLVYGALTPLGKPLAALGCVLLFALAHAQQTWGNWGALASVTLTGAVLTALRSLSGSTLVPAVAHLLYNLSLWRDSFRG